MKTIPQTNIRSAGSFILTGALALGLLGCASSQQARSVKTSGFLKDYSMLQKAQGDVAHLIYVNPETDWTQYDKIIVEPVTIWRVPGSKLEDLPEKELDDLGRYFWSAIKTEMGKDYKLVNEPGPGTLRFRVALTEAEKANVTMDMVTTVVPIGLGISAVKKLATGTHSFVGKATIEGEIRSSETGEVLAAGVDTRVGGKTIAGKKRSSWGDVQEAANLWATRFRTNLAKARAGTLVIEKE